MAQVKIMDRTPVISEVLRSVGYDPDQRILEIEFVSGSTYRYFDVPDELYVALMAADSQGECFTMSIRDAGFDYQQIG
ncbi:MAG: KTSC domain-containing protein [Lysobacter sp.]|nr:KTSC domain-containing protein [Lysobacter sp.]